PKYPEDPIIAHVSFMYKRDAMDAKRDLDGIRLLGYKIRISWGRFIPIPDKPIYDYRYKRQPSEIRVMIPRNKELLDRINKIALFVAHDGYQFERIIKERERGNPKFDFLFYEDSNDHIYYMWKVYSLTQVCKLI